MIRFPGVAAFARRPFILAPQAGVLQAGKTGFSILASDVGNRMVWWPFHVVGGVSRNFTYTGDAPGTYYDHRQFDLIDVGSAQHGTTNRVGTVIEYWLHDDQATEDWFTYTIRDDAGQEATGICHVNIAKTTDDAFVLYGGDPNDWFAPGNLWWAAKAFKAGAGTVRISYGVYDDSVSLNNGHNDEIIFEGVKNANGDRPVLKKGTVFTTTAIGKTTVRSLEVDGAGQWVSFSTKDDDPGFTFRVEDCIMKYSAGNGIHGNHPDLMLELIDSEFSHAGQGNTKHIVYSLGKYLYVKGCKFHSARLSEMLKQRYRAFLIEDTDFDATVEDNPLWTEYMPTDHTNHHTARGMYRRCKFTLYPRSGGVEGSTGIAQRNSYFAPKHGTQNPDFYPMHGENGPYAAYPVAETDPRFSWPDGDPGASAFWQDEFWNQVRSLGFNPEDQNPYLYQVYHEECTWEVRADVDPDQHQYARAVQTQGQQPGWRPGQFLGNLSFPIDRPMGWVPRIKLYFANCDFINFLDPSSHIFDSNTGQFAFHTPEDCVGPYTTGGGQTYGLCGHEPKWNPADPDPWANTFPFAKPGEALPDTGWAPIIGTTFDFSAGGNNDDRDPADLQAFFGNNNPKVTELPSWWGFNAGNDGDDFDLFPQIVSAEVVDSDTIVLTWGTKDLDVAGPNTASDYTYTIGAGAAQTVTTVTTDNATQVTLSGLETPVPAGEVVLLTFSGASRQNALRGTNFNRAKPFSGWSVVNTL